MKGVFYYFCVNILLPMYILKIKGSARIADYIQIRDNKFTLIGYFRADMKTHILQKFGLDEKETEINRIIQDMPYGKMIELPF